LAALGAAPIFTSWYNLAALGAVSNRQAPCFAGRYDLAWIVRSPSVQQLFPYLGLFKKFFPYFFVFSFKAFFI
jgi:hypothetical protein